MNDITQQYMIWFTLYREEYTWTQYYYNFVESEKAKSNVQRDYKRNGEINRNVSETKRSNKTMTYEIEDLDGVSEELYINYSTGNMIYTNENEETTEIVTDNFNETITHIWPLKYTEFSTDTVDLFVDIPNVIYSPDRFSLNEEETGIYRGYLRFNTDNE